MQAPCSNVRNPGHVERLGSDRSRPGRSKKRTWPAVKVPRNCKQQKGNRYAANLRRGRASFSLSPNAGMFLLVGMQKGSCISPVFCGEDERAAGAMVRESCKMFTLEANHLLVI
ncbi:hypothetical protein V2G26_009126 [Clonostachys chloroleuca]